MTTENFDPAADGPVLEPVGVPLTYKSYCKRRLAYGFSVGLTEEQWKAWNAFNNRRQGEPPCADTSA